MLGAAEAMNDVALIGLPDEKWGERVHAVIVLHQGATVSEKDLIAWCDGRFARFKRPRGVTFACVGLTAGTYLDAGASGSLGACFARVLPGAGARVALAARRVEVINAPAAEIGTASALALDVATRDTVGAAFDAAEVAPGGPIDIVTNNGGIADPGALMDQTDDNWAQVMAVNLDGARRLANETARRPMAAGQGGVVVNVASILGLRQGAGVAAYATSKATLVQLTKRQALEWERLGIRVKALAPGYIETDINRDFFASEAGRAQIKRIPMRRLGQAHDLDGARLLLASVAGVFITGAMLVADGGHPLSPL